MALVILRCFITARVLPYLRQCFQTKKLRALFADAAFISRGYQNWKDATVARNHEKSSCHKESVEKLITLPPTTTNIVDSLSFAAAEERKCSQACFLKILHIVCIFWQGKGCHFVVMEKWWWTVANLSQLLALQCRNNDEQLAEWLRRKSNKYTGHDMQNEML